MKKRAKRDTKIIIQAHRSKHLLYDRTLNLKQRFSELEKISKIYAEALYEEERFGKQQQQLFRDLSCKLDRFQREWVRISKVPANDIAEEHRLNTFCMGGYNFCKPPSRASRKAKEYYYTLLSKKHPTTYSHSSLSQSIVNHCYQPEYMEADQMRALSRQKKKDFIKSKIAKSLKSLHNYEGELARMSLPAKLLNFEEPNVKAVQDNPIFNCPSPRIKRNRLPTTRPKKEGKFVVQKIKQVDERLMDIFTQKLNVHWELNVKSLRRRRYEKKADSKERTTATTCIIDEGSD